jgi:2-polyprenyl-3-methyl-5-hydroxy-6-metoxy-1,4-benzoquinol methylase
MEEEKNKEKELDSKVLNFLEGKRLTNMPAYAIWDITEEIYDIKIGDKHFPSRKILEVGCAVGRLEECEKIVGINVKDNDITYYMTK